MSLTKKIEKELVFEIIIFCIGIAEIALFYKNNLLLTFLLVLSLLIGIKFWYKKHDIHFYIAGAIIGPIGEIVCVYFGVWQYAIPTLLGIPLWLPLVWGGSIVLIKRVVETFGGIKKK